MKRLLLGSTIRVVAVGVIGWGTFCPVETHGQPVSPNVRGQNPAPITLPAAANRALSAEQVEAARTAGRAGVNVEWAPGLGTPRLVRGQDLGARQGFSGGKGMALRGGGAYEQDAVAVMDNLARLYRLQDAQREFASRRAQEDTLGFHHVRLKQMYRGLPVFGGDVVVHFNKQDKAFEVSGQYVSDIQVGIVPQIQVSNAISIAQQDLVSLGKPAGTVSKQPALVIFAEDTAPRLAYELTLSYSDRTEPGRWRYWVDAQQGQVLLRYNNIQNIDEPTSNGHHTPITGTILSGEGGGITTNVVGWYENTGFYYLWNTNYNWFVYNIANPDANPQLWGPDANTFAFRSTSDWGTSDTAEMSAARNVDLVQKYYLQVQSRHSFDNSNSMMPVVTLHAYGFANAFWDGEAIWMGDGGCSFWLDSSTCLGTMNSLAVLDIVGHEFTHAVTEYSSGLMETSNYEESGMLNESFSDVMGASIEFWAQPDGRSGYPSKIAGAADWLIGEDSCVSPRAIRDMRNPSNSDTNVVILPSPAFYGGPHFNWLPHTGATIQDFFFYLLCEGGSGTNDGTPVIFNAEGVSGYGVPYNVTGIGITNAQKVAYLALTAYCTPHTDYYWARQAWISAAMQFDNVNGTHWADSVSNAWHAVGVDQRPSTPIFPGFNSVCDGQVTVGWYAAGGATGYKVKRSDTPEGPYTVIANVAATKTYAGFLQRESYSDTTGNIGVWRYYTISATNAYGESADAPAYGAAPVATPTTPTGLTVGSVCNAQVALSWNPAQGGYAYFVYRSTNHGGPYQLARSSGGPSCIDTGLTPGTTYYYVVSSYANQNCGESPVSSEVSATPLPSTPSTPSGLTVVSAVNAKVTLRWNPSSLATVYKVKRSVTSGGPYTIIGSPTGTNYTDSTAVNDTTYYYVVSAFSGASCESGNSPQITAKPLATPIITSQPISQTVNAGNPVTFAVVATGSSLKYQWQFNGINIPGAIASSYTISSVNAGHAGSFGVVVYNTVGTNVSAAALLTVSTSPGALSATVTAGSLTATSFTLNCQAAAGTTWTVFKSSDQFTWTAIGNVTMASDGTAQFSVDVTGVSGGYYRIRNGTANYSNITGFTRSLITTVIGDHGLGGTYSGDGGPALSAGLSGPMGITLTSGGVLYIADFGNARVRVVGMGGGNSGISSPAFDSRNNTQDGLYLSVLGVAVDAGNGVYIADSDQTLFYYGGWPCPPTYVVPELAGTASVFLSGGGSPSLYCVDSGNRISKRTPAWPNPPGSYSIVAGNGQVGYSGDGGLAINAKLSVGSSLATTHGVVVSTTTIDAQGNLYIADIGNNVIRKVATNGIISTYAGNYSLGAGYTGDGGLATSARLNHPSGLAVDSLGNLFIADAGNHVIRRVDVSNRIISTVVGSGTAGYSGDNDSAKTATLKNPGGLLFDASGNLYLADTGNDVIRKVSFGFPAFVYAGALSDTSFTLKCVAPAGSTWTVFRSSDQVGWTSLGNITMDANGTYQYVDSTIAGVGSRYYKIVSGTLSSGITGFSRPIITTVIGNHSLGGTFSGDGGPAASAGLSCPLGITYYNGNLAIADMANSTVRFVNSSGYIYSPWGQYSTFTSPMGVGLDGNGYLYVADGDWGCVRELQGGNNPFCLNSGMGLSLTLDASRTNLYSVDGYGNTVSKMHTVVPYNGFPDGIVTIVAGNGTQGYSGDGGPATSAQLFVSAWYFLPHGVVASSATVDGQGNIYIADIGNNVVRKVNTSGIISTVAGKNSLGAGYSGDGGQAVNAQLNHPAAVAVDPQGNLYIADSGNHVIRKVATTGIITTVAGTGTAGYSGDGGAAINATLYSPGGLTFDTAGNLYISDSGNDVVRKIAF